MRENLHEQVRFRRSRSQSGTLQKFQHSTMASNLSNLLVSVRLAAVRAHVSFAACAVASSNMTRVTALTTDILLDACNYFN